MTSIASSEASPTPRPAADAASDKRWLFGPVTDLLLGCGVGYAILIALIPWFGFEAYTIGAIGLLSSLLIATPHYGATLLRVYSSRSDLRKYAFFTIYASAIVWLGFVVGLYDLTVGSFLITLYFTWSPWHYAGQNYGLGVMFLRRRGVPLPDLTKRLLYASFLLSYLLTFLTMHSARGDVSYGVGSFMGTRYEFMELGVPGVYGLVSVFSVVLLAYAVTTTAAAVRLLRTTPARELLPVACLVATQALWFVVPHTWGWATGRLLESETIAFLFVWAILGHSVQYLWVTTYYAVGSQRGLPRWRHLAGTLAAGSLVWTLPALVFSAQWIGTHPYNLGLFLMIAAGVNLQHFILDGAIWKLRDTGVGSVLLAQPDEGEAQGADAVWPGWLRGAAWAVGSALFAVALVSAWEGISLNSALRTGDDARFASARARLVSLGRDEPSFYLHDAQAALQSGDFEAALGSATQSLELYPTSDAWLVVGLVHDRAGRVQPALSSYRESVTLDPREWRAWHRAGVLLAGRGQFAEAVDALQQATALAPAEAGMAAILERIRADAAAAASAGGEPPSP